METIGQRIGRFLALVSILFALSLALIVAERLSRDALTLLVGIAIGALLLVPLTAFLLLLWRRQEARLTAQMEMHGASRQTSPPVIVVAPPLYGSAQPSSHALRDEAVARWEQSARPQRAFTFVGED